MVNYCFATGWWPPVKSWFMNPIKYSYIYHKILWNIPHPMVYCYYKYSYYRMYISTERKKLRAPSSNIRFFFALGGLIGTLSRY